MLMASAQLLLIFASRKGTTPRTCYDDAIEMNERQTEVLIVTHMPISFQNF